jgi:two-component system phosphate regulon response regulator PhoB
MTKLLPTSVLIATAENDLMNELSNNFISNNFNVTKASSGDESIQFATHKEYDIIILDSSLPDISGIGVCTVLRTKKCNKSTPIIMMTEEEGEFNLVKGAESGIDDYVVKPTSISDLISRVRNLTKRAKPSLGNSCLQYQDLKIDIASYRVTRGGKEIHLGPTEFKMLRCLMEFPKRILSREYLINSVWGKVDNIEPRTIDVHINRLRTALKKHTEDYSLIKTIRASGYCLGTPSNVD